MEMRQLYDRAFEERRLVSKINLICHPARSEGSAFYFCGDSKVSRSSA
jgi:hypothetical protein